LVSLALDFRLPDARYLFLAAEPQQPRLYLIKRAVRELEKQSLPPSPFALLLRKQLSGAMLLALTKDEGERIVRFNFNAQDIVGTERPVTLVMQLTGRSANLLITDENGRVEATLRPGQGEGQEVGGMYRPPPPAINRASPLAAALPFSPGDAGSWSEAADDFYRQQASERAFRDEAGALLAKLRQKAARTERLRANLAADLATHGDAEQHKRVGDLLLANLATARREGSRVRLLDYFAEDAPEIEVEAEENLTLSEAAERSFARYAKAKRAAEEVARRLVEIDREASALHGEIDEMQRIIDARDIAALERRRAKTFRSPTKEARPAREKRDPSLAGMRRYRSSDGYEVLVGRAAHDNDRLTFRVARPHDLWLHAADYPGSHVVVLNQHRQSEVPHRTVVEAAQLAAFFSQARSDAKVNVHYTARKFLSKPKGAAPGLVRLSQFRTLVVEPREVIERV
jgi:predicted ribosome quality control (RQC) complex YloA/Tae2 family protein